MWTESHQSIVHNDRRLSAVYTAAGSKKIVIFCHGYRSTSIGPRRFFVTAARALAEAGIDSLRFDHYGSGNSEGVFLDSRFDDWVETVTALCKIYLDQGYQVALFGQSMGASTAIVVASQLPQIRAMVAWVPDPGVDTFIPSPTGYLEEAGERVANEYWQQAHDAKIADKLGDVSAPSLIVQCTDDEYVSLENRTAINNNAQPNHEVKTYKGYTHSSWSYDEAQSIIDASVAFITNHLT